jgi:hypothetical protein
MKATFPRAYASSSRRPAATRVDVATAPTSRTAPISSVLYVSRGGSRIVPVPSVMSTLRMAHCDQLENAEAHRTGARCSRFSDRMRHRCARQGRVLDGTAHPGRWMIASRVFQILEPEFLSKVARRASLRRPAAKERRRRSDTYLAERSRDRRNPMRTQSQRRTSS